MILIPILLAFFTGLLILRLCNQHKYLNIFEQLALGFVSALSLFVFELFIGGIIFDKLSLIGPIISFVVCFLLLIYKNHKQTGFIKEIIHHIKSNLENVQAQFQGLQKWQKFVVIGIGIYVVFKLFMVFSINTHMPTFDEDAVAGWDMKTKIFAENKSLVLDKNSPEFLGSALERNIFAPLTDTYFLLSSKGDINGFTNIISPLLYLISILLLFGIFLRKTNLLRATLSGYIFISLPFVFIHGFGSYWNFASGVFLFIFIFYLIDQICNLENDSVENKYMYLILCIMIFLTMLIRNESSILTIMVFVASIGLYGTIKKISMNGIKANMQYIAGPLVSIAIARISNRYIIYLYPSGSNLRTGMGKGMLSSMLQNIQQPGVIGAPRIQAVKHPDYNLFFLMFIAVCILYFIHKLNYKKLMLYIVSFCILAGATIAMLYANLDLGLVTHLSFIRYGVLFIMPMIFIVVYMLDSIVSKYFISEPRTHEK